MSRLLAHNWGSTTLGDCAAIVRRLARPSRLAVGSEIERYEAEFAERIGVRHAVSFSAGRLALYGIIKALNLGPGDEVLLQAPTHIVVPNAIRFTGATPVFVDCSDDDYNMDFGSAAERVTKDTRLLLLQHTFGVPADLDAACAFAEANDLVLIEDCVHALGARFNGQPVGSIGRAAFFSTEETKTISSTMGGMAVTDDDELAAALRAFQAACAIPSRSLVARYMAKQLVYHLFTHPRIHRFTRPIYMWLRERPITHLAPGPTGSDETHGGRPAFYEMRFSNGQAAIARRQLRRLDANIAHRNAIANRFAAALPALGFTVPRPAKGAEPAYVRFPTRVADRALAMQTAKASTILGRWFTSVLEESATTDAGGYVDGSCPRAELAARELVNLPTHQRVNDADAAALIEVFAQIAPARPNA